MTTLPQVVRFTKLFACEPPVARARTRPHAVCFAAMSMTRASTARTDQLGISFVSSWKRTMPLLHRVQGGARAR
jgi:hypothetical protein